MIQILLARQYIQRLKKQCPPHGLWIRVNDQPGGNLGTFLEPDFTRRVEEKLEQVMETLMTRDAAD